MNGTVLEVKNIKKSYGKERVLDGVSFSLNKGEAKVIVGPSGTGKSTLLRCINYLTEPDDGEVYLEAKKIGEAISKNEARTRIGFVFQHFNLYKHLTALRNVTLALEKVGGMSKKRAKDKGLWELERVGLADQANKYPGELSGGQQQRVGIARALSMSPVLVLFDEPTSALDPELIGEVLEVMKELAEENLTMLVVTHEMGFAQSVASEIFFMENGRIVESGPPTDLIHNPREKRTKEFLRNISKL
ncbi:MAG: amino acid ABC transporter ATP-binding protein [candidate division WOR-3 bacterium]|nr:amino acid ABC transporter ATP-binding protein [candidate division WOR-3 bacterium]